MRNAPKHTDINQVRRSLREAYKHIAAALENSTRAKAFQREVNVSLTNRLKILEHKLLEEIEALELSYSPMG